MLGLARCLFEKILVRPTLILYPLIMPLSNLSSADLTRLIVLIKEKESLQEKLMEINRQLESIESGTPSLTKRGRKPGRPPGTKPTAGAGTRKRRGKRLKDRLLKVLEASGSAGVNVKDLASELGVKSSNVFSWFYTTGKKIKGIKKVGEARYSYAA
jgi:uncharacterized protein YjcR